MSSPNMFRITMIPLCAGLVALAGFDAPGKDAGAKAPGPGGAGKRTLNRPAPTAAAGKENLPLTKIWSFTQRRVALPDGAFSPVFDSSPAITGGRVYAGGGDGYCGMLCLDAETGEKVWMFRTLAPPRSPTVVGKRVYVGSLQTLYCLDAETGKKLWEFRTPTQPGITAARPGHYAHTGNVFGTPAVAGGSVYAATHHDGSLFCLDAATGKLRWRYKEAIRGGSRFYCSPLVSKGLVFLSHGTAVNARTGRVAWRTRDHDQGSSCRTPALLGGLLFILADEVHCVNVGQAGQQVWKSNLAVVGGRLRRSRTGWSNPRALPVLENGRLVLTGEDFQFGTGTKTPILICLSARDGRRLWEIKLGPHTVSWVSTPFAAGNRVFVGVDDRLHAYDLLTGRRLEEFEAGCQISHTPVVVGDRVYFGTQGGGKDGLQPARFFCLRAGVTGPKAWPTVGGNMERNGRVPKGLMKFSDRNRANRVKQEAPGAEADGPPQVAAKENRDAVKQILDGKWKKKPESPVRPQNEDEDEDD